jgi:hypothetical protein
MEEEQVFFSGEEIGICTKGEKHTFDFPCNNRKLSN